MRTVATCRRRSRGHAGKVPLSSLKSAKPGTIKHRSSIGGLESEAEADMAAARLIQIFTELAANQTAEVTRAANEVALALSSSPPTS